MSAIFNRYIGIDYSGAETCASSLKKLARGRGRDAWILRYLKGEVAADYITLSLSGLPVDQLL
jgi:hypothetical protein